MESLGAQEATKYLSHLRTCCARDAILRRLRISVLLQGSRLLRLNCGLAEAEGRLFPRNHSRLSSLAPPLGRSRGCRASASRRRDGIFGAFRLFCLAFCLDGRMPLFHASAEAETGAHRNRGNAIAPSPDLYRIIPGP
jgi:hypothetical protein